MLVLLVTGALRRSRPVLWRYSLGAAVGAIWAVLPFMLLFPSWMFSTIVGVGISMLMCQIAYRCRGWKKIAASAATLYAVTWCTGGCLNALYYQTKVGSFFRHLLYGGSEGVTALWLFFTAALVCGCFMAASWWYQHVGSNARLLYPVELCFRGRKVELTALLDTGNRLYTLTGKPVSITELAVLEQLSQEMADMIKGYFEGTLTEPDSMSGMMLVPFQSIGKEHEMMPVVWIDTMTIKKNTAEETITKAAIGISRTSFAKGKEYQMILHRSFGHMDYLS